MPVTLEPYTLDRCQAFWRGYTADPAMWSEPCLYYGEENVTDYYQNSNLGF